MGIMLEMGNELNQMRKLHLFRRCSVESSTYYISDITVYK